MNLDFTQIGIIVFFIALLGYIVGIYFERSYLLRPKGGDFERYLELTSKGIILIIFASLLSIYSFFNIIPTMAKTFFPDANTDKLFALIFVYLLLLGILAVIIMVIPFFGQWFRKLKERFNPMEITIQADDRTLPIIASEIYDENVDFFYYIDKNKNWGLIKKSHVSSIKSEIIRRNP